MAKKLSYSINHKCENPTTLNYKTPLISVYAPDNATTQRDGLFSVKNLPMNEETVFTEEKFKFMFEATRDFFKAIYREGLPVSTVRYLNYIIYKYEGETLVYLTYSDSSDPGLNIIHTTYPIKTIHPDLEKLYIQYLKFLIYHSSLEEFIERELSTNDEVDPTKENYIRVSVDLYLNRSISDPKFHKDSYAPNHVHYVTLSYYTEQETTGPEIIGWSKEHERIGETSIVVRPLIPIMGTVGFNDWIFLHSSPIDIIDLTNIFNQKQPIFDPELLKQGYLEYSVRGASQRFPVQSPESRDFLRTWWHLEPKILNDKKPLDEEGVYLLFGTVQKINDPKRFNKNDMEIEGEELPPFSPDFENYVNKVRKNGSERIEYNIASFARDFNDYDGRIADIVRLFNVSLPGWAQQCSRQHNTKHPILVGGITKKRRKSKNKRSSNKKNNKRSKKRSNKKLNKRSKKRSTQKRNRKK